jgi:hypothetical protein
MGGTYIVLETLCTALAYQMTGPMVRKVSSRAVEARFYLPHEIHLSAQGTHDTDLR